MQAFDPRCAFLSGTLMVITAGLAACDLSGMQSGAPRTVEASCGECQFGLPGEGCTLAVRFDGVAYFVDGSDIDAHGDAHAPEGLCNMVRTALVKGDVVDGRFMARFFVLRPNDG